MSITSICLPRRNSTSSPKIAYGRLWNDFISKLKLGSFDLR
ncbi:hypothetical protein [Saccharopolyspora sp. NPDC002376]